MELDKSKEKGEKDLSLVLTKAKGTLPAKDKKTYEIIVRAVTDFFGLKRSVDIMVANRLAATWMKMCRVEELLAKYDVCFEVRNKSGDLVGMTVNQLAYYLKSLEADFRAYYRVLVQNNKRPQDNETDFHDFLNDKKGGNP